MAKKELQPQKQSKALLPKLSKRKSEMLVICPNVKLLITKLNFDSCLERYFRYSNAEESLMSGKLRLREIAAIYEPSAPILLIRAWLINLASFMGFEITDQQAKETGRYIYEEVGMLNIAELTLLFKRIKKGQYGEFYGRFNGQIILRACREYRKERGKILVALSTDEQLKLSLCTTATAMWSADKLPQKLSINH